MILTILIVGLFITMAIGTPIAWALGISGLGAVLLMGVPLNTVPQKIFSGMDIFPLMCIPFFVLAGELMAKGGLTRRLLDFAVIMVGHIRGGLSLANVVASMLFGGITGSAIADSSALGSVEIPMMVENGYDPEYSAAVTAASACIGPIIPPSIPVVIYSMTSSSPHDAPRGMEFLYDGHRFNVATSRARALCILVGSPALFEPECKTPHQMKMANGFCRYLELARIVE